MGIKNYIQPVLALRVAEAGVSTSPITINDDVWIGANAVIVGNITIGDDVMIAPNAYVNMDVPSHSIALGNPVMIHERENATEGYINRRINIE